MPGSLCDVLPAAAALLDVEDAVDRLAVADWVGADRIDRVLVVLVDGLGWHLLAQLAGNAPLANLWYLLTASPWARWLKAKMFHSAACAETFART